MNITEKTVRCPIVSVTMPSDHARLNSNTANITSGLVTRLKSHTTDASVRMLASVVATALSWNAVSISSLPSAGVPVTPASTPGYSARRRAIVPRMAAMTSRLSTKLPASRRASTSMNSSFLSRDRKYPARCSRSPLNSSRHGDGRGAVLSRRSSIAVSSALTKPGSRRAGWSSSPRSMKRPAKRRAIS